MRGAQLGVGLIVAAALASAPAWAGAASVPASKTVHGTTLGPNDEAVPVVTPGEEIGIACDALPYAAPGKDVRVVFTISPEPGGAPSPGYNRVLATNQQLTKGAVHVRVPETPDIADHTVHVDVYVARPDGGRSCNAGHMRIAKRSDHSQGKQS